MLNTTILAALGTPEIIIILVVVLLLFGGKKIPELMRGLGKGVKEFKEGISEDEKSWTLFKTVGTFVLHTWDWFSYSYDLTFRDRRFQAIQKS